MEDVIEIHFRGVPGGVIINTAIANITNIVIITGTRKRRKYVSLILTD